MTSSFDEIIKRVNTNSVKWEFIPAGDETVKNKLLPLWIADMDFTCAEPILEALRERVDHGIFGYSSPYSSDYLLAVTSWFKSTADWEINPEHLVVSTGVVPALSLLIRGLTNVNDGIIIQRPVYYPFMDLIRNNKRKIVNNALVNANGYYRIDFDDLEVKARDPETKLLIFCNPHNPVGRVWTEQELGQVADICLKNNVIIISDEIHCDLIRKNSQYVPLNKVNNDDRIITCTAASKSFNLAGLQVANIVMPSAEMRDIWQGEQYGKSGMFGVNPFGIVATKAAYTKGKPWLDKVNSYIDANLEFVAEFVAEYFPKATYQVPEGTYFAWIDFRNYRIEFKKLEEMLVYKAHLALDEGYIFGKEGEGFERINVACPRFVLQECLNRMKSVIQ